MGKGCLLGVMETAGVSGDTRTILGIPCCCVPQLCPILCNPMDYSPPGSSDHGDSSDKNTRVGCHALLQGSSQPRDRTSLMFPALAGRFFTTSSTWYILFFIFFSTMIYCRILDIFSCAIPRLYIKKQIYYFANKGPSRQGYGFSSGHVWM